MKATTRIEIGCEGGRGAGSEISDTSLKGVQGFISPHVESAWVFGGD